jgi:exopolyphosphatase/guanosine-5'-triphosphate,3'-diphosphate pyrophosphatase
MVGGSAQFIGILCSKPDEDGIVRFSKDKMKEIIKLYSEIDEEKADYLIKTLPKRHLLIIPAATAFLAIFDYMGIEQLTISKGGIREGYMKYLLSKKASN